VAEAERRDGVLQRREEHVALQRLVKLGAADEDLVHDTGQAHRLEVVVDDQPLVVEADQAARNPKALAGAGALEPERLRLGLDRVHDVVVEAQNSEVELGDDQVLVVAQVADKRPRLEVHIALEAVGDVLLRDHARLEQRTDARQVALEVLRRRNLHPWDARSVGVVAHAQTDPVKEPLVGAAGIRPVVVVTVEVGPVAVHGVEVKRRPAQVPEILRDLVRVHRHQRRLRDVARRRVPIRVRRHVVIDELTPVGVHRRDVRVHLHRGVGLPPGGAVDHRRAQRLEGGRDRRRVTGDVGVRLLLEVRQQVVKRRPWRWLLGEAESQLLRQVLRARRVLGEDVTTVVQIEHRGSPWVIYDASHQWHLGPSHLRHVSAQRELQHAVRLPNQDLATAYQARAHECNAKRLSISFF